MDRLASCYFCGVAVEAPLEEYPVVPRDLRPSVEDQSTVVLCPECRRKLSTIVERVVAANSDPAQTELSESAGAAAEAGKQDELSEQSPVKTVERFDDERPNLGNFDTSHDRDGEPATREADPNVNAGASRTDSGTEAGTADSNAESKTATAGQNDEAKTAAANSNDETETTTADEEGQNEGDVAQPAEETDPNTAAKRSSQSQPPEKSRAGGNKSEQTEEELSARSSTDADSSTSERGSTADRDFSTSSYNKVVKLLQNREFPVEEEEITTVAGSAYGIGHREANNVIDALIERGILERDGSRLHRSDD